MFDDDVRLAAEDSGHTGGDTPCGLRHRASAQRDEHERAFGVQRAGQDRSRDLTHAVAGDDDMSRADRRQLLGCDQTGRDDQWLSERRVSDCVRGCVAADVDKVDSDRLGPPSQSRVNPADLEPGLQLTWSLGTLTGREDSEHRTT